MEIRPMPDQTEQTPLNVALLAEALLQALQHRFPAYWGHSEDTPHDHVVKTPVNGDQDHG
jgi:hypothetical protein